MNSRLCRAFLTAAWFLPPSWPPTLLTWVHGGIPLPPELFLSDPSVLLVSKNVTPFGWSYPGLRPTFKSSIISWASMSTHFPQLFFLPAQRPTSSSFPSPGLLSHFQAFLAFTDLFNLLTYVYLTITYYGPGTNLGAKKKKLCET